jgi:hypothetical protein
MVHESPAAYTFDGLVLAAYPPWTEPSYWYAGLKPRLKLAAQCRAIAKNVIVTLKLLVLSPIAVCLLGLALFKTRKGDRQGTSMASALLSRWRGTLFYFDSDAA